MQMREVACPTCTVHLQVSIPVQFFPYYQYLITFPFLFGIVKLDLCSPDACNTAFNGLCNLGFIFYVAIWFLPECISFIGGAGPGSNLWFRDHRV